MIGRREREQESFWIAGTLYDFIPDDHILKRVDKVLDLSWLREEVRDCYDERQGRPSIDPESAVRLMLAGFFQGIVHDRKLMREAQVNLAIRWFAGYKLGEELPDHSSLTRIRQRWGVERFRRVFEKTVQACVRAGLVGGDTVHIDATLIRADVSWRSLTERHVKEVLEANNVDEDIDQRSAARAGGGKSKVVKQSRTDPDATLATSNKGQRPEPSYKQHTAVDATSGVIVDVELTTGGVNEGTKLVGVLERVERQTGKKVERVTADGSYSHSVNYRECEERGIDPVISLQPEARGKSMMPLRRFKYDARHGLVRCPGGKKLHRIYKTRQGWVYRASARACRGCQYRVSCVAPSMRARVVLIVEGYEALSRARRRWLRFGQQMRGLYERHRWRVEGVHGTAKTQHGLRRAVRRGLANVAIQVYLTAAVMNLKGLARLFCWFLGSMCCGIGLWTGLHRASRRLFQYSDLMVPPRCGAAR